ncbi:MAG: family 1 glycosylhydrolase, partial [bacterium]|nr:family 1 glycosylhydrolase [bacterium]
MALKFPDNFFWGAATSAHQIEGGNIHNDWWKFENSEARINELKTKGLDPKNFISGRACDFYNRFEDDL